MGSLGATLRIPYSVFMPSEVKVDSCGKGREGYTIRGGGGNYLSYSQAADQQQQQQLEHTRMWNNYSKPNKWPL